MPTEIHQAALDEVRQIATALHTLGGSATVAQLATATGLHPQTVTKRLAGGAISCRVPVLFARKRTCVRGKGESVWGLTSSGAALANG